MTDSIKDYHRKFLAILETHLRAGGQGLPEQRAPVWVTAAGHHAIRALIEDIHDQGYVLGQLHADGIFPEGEEADVAAREERLGIEDRKERERSRQRHPSRSGQVVHGIRPHLPRTPEEDRAARELALEFQKTHPVNLSGLDT